MSYWSRSYISFADREQKRPTKIHSLVGLSFDGNDLLHHLLTYYAIWTVFSAIDIANENSSHLLTASLSISISSFFRSAVALFLPYKQHTKAQSLSTNSQKQCSVEIYSLYQHLAISKVGLFLICVSSANTYGQVSDNTPSGVSVCRITNTSPYSNSYWLSSVFNSTLTPIFLSHSTACDIIMVVVITILLTCRVLHQEYPTCRK